MKSLVCITCGHRQFDFPTAHLMECQACGNQYLIEKNLSKKPQRTRHIDQNVAIGYDAENVALGPSAGNAVQGTSCFTSVAEQILRR